MLSAKKELFTPSGGGYQISRSVRTRSSASAYFNRTFSTPTLSTKWTWSGWVKRGTLGAAQTLFSGQVDVNNWGIIAFLAGDTLSFQQADAGSVTSTVTTTQVFRDSSAWYHIIVVFDSTQATAANRLIMYVNGVQITAFGTATYLAQNTASRINAAVAHQLSRYISAAQYFDGYMTEVNFVDGQALTPSSFGETNAVTGVWQPKRYAGTYGTNGFYLPFTLNANSTYAGSFNGSSQGLTTTATGINPSTGSWTIEGWAYSTNAAANEAIITGQVSGSDYLYWNYVGTTLYIGDGVTNILTISNAKPTNQWYHWALVKNGSTYTAYINGQSIGSSTTALRSGTLTTWQIGIRTSVSYYWNGSISNVRVNSTTAIYTTKFTPPISPLTAISGTQLLTLQDATIIDNSTNAYSITNTGSVATTTSTVVFAAPTIGSDASGNVNNWTANNINVSTAGATYDSMIDVPTLYDDGDKGRGNYAVMNAVDNTLTLSNANLYAQETVADTYGASRATIAIPTSGKWYWEHKIANAPTGSSITVGLATSTAVLGGVLTGATTTASYSTRYAIGRTIANGATLVRNDAAIAFTTNDIVQCAYDAATGKLWFGKNNAWFDTSTGTTGNPSAGTNQIITVTLTGPLFPFISSFHEVGSGGAATYVNFGQQPFTYTPPTGFKALNTQNLPTPTISNGALYMAATTYTGNGTTQSISNAVNGVSFQPDFVWFKNRTGANNHALYDSVRGRALGLISNATNAEQSASAGNDLVSFDSNGVSLGPVEDFTSVNGSAQSIVAWQWNAGGTSTNITVGQYGTSPNVPSIASTVRANPTAGFSVVTYTGAGGVSTIGHGLGVAPSFFVVKNRTQASDWECYFATLGNTTRIVLNSTAAQVTGVNGWNSTSPTSTVFTVNGGTAGNTAGNNHLAYCFAAVAGYSAFGKYTGNGSADGVFVYLGFRARFLMIKRTDSTGGWVMLDTARDTYNDVDNYLYANSSAADAGSSNVLDINSNGFKIRNSWTDINASGGTYVYMAFCENPFKFSNAR